MERKHPDRIEIAGRFATDAHDFLTRFRCTYYSEKFDFQSIKSRRMKAFIDLRIALECALKAYIAIRQPYTSGGLKLIKQIESYGHNLDKLFDSACDLWGVSVSEDWQQIVQDCSKLNIGIRYAFDAYDFRIIEEKFYYHTIGSDHWIKHLYEELQVLASYLGKILQRRNKAKNAADISYAEIVNYEYKYKK